MRDSVTDASPALGQAQGTTDIFTVMATRRSIKRFSHQPVEMDKILQVVQAGTLAPSSGNIQNWSFVVVTDIDKIRAMYHHTLDQEPFLTATAAVIVCGDVEYAHTMYGMRGKRLYTIQNCAAATQNMLLAAHALGLGGIWIGGFDEDKVASMFSIPNHRYRPQAIVLLGYADYEPEPKETKPLEGVVFFNKFGERVLRPHLIFYDWVTEWRNQAQKVRSHLGEIKNERVERRKKQEQEKKESGAENPFALTKRRIRDAIDSLKKEQYRGK